MGPLTTRQRKALLVLQSLAGKDKIAKISVTKLAKELGLKGGAQQIIYALTIKGYIEIIPGDTMQDGNSYKLLKKA